MPTPVDQWQQADSWPRLAASLRFNDTLNVDITEFQTNLHKAEHKGWCDTEFSTKEHDVRGRSSSRTLLHSEAACPAVAAFKRAAEICTWRQCGLATY